MVLIVPSRVVLENVRTVYVYVSTKTEMVLIFPPAVGLRGYT